jgi:hypothetical protein
LQESDIDVDALVVNRMHPQFAPDERVGARERARTLRGTPLEPLYANLADFAEIAEREESYFADLRSRLPGGAVARVPFLSDDVHDIDGLKTVADYLFAS